MFAMCCAAAGAGCTSALKPSSTSPETRVAYQAKFDAGAPHYEQREDEVSNNPIPITNPAPIYPKAAISQHLALVVIEAKVIVDSNGKVSEVRIAQNGDASHLQFETAVRDAVSQWTYAPLTFTRWEEVKDAQGNVIDSRPASVERKPFSLDYEFRFELRDGKPVVDAQPQRK